MRTAISLTTALSCLTFTTALAAQDGFTGGGPLFADGSVHEVYDDATLQRDFRQAARELGLDRQASMAAASYSRADGERLNFPLRTSADHEDAQIHTAVNFVDLTGSGGGVRDSECGTRTYDGHQGIDYLAAPFWWSAMDNHRAEVVAAAPGTILLKVDGQYDRQCRVNSSQDNLVVVLHDDGLVAIYRHLKSGSLTTAQVGDRVETGDFIGIVGSSGSSTAPHLHFELQIYEEGQLGGGQVVDPNAGPCGDAESLWRHQPQYFDPDILSLRTHTQLPTFGSFSSACVQDQPNLAHSYQPGDRGYWAVYLRNQRPGELVNLEVLRPDGSRFAQWDLGASLTAFQPFTYWYGTDIIPADAPAGNWRFRARFGDRVVERVFRVGGSEFDTNARIRSSVLPASRSVIAGNAATVFSTVINPGDAAGIGCSIRPAQPFDGRFEFRETDPATNAITGEPNVLFDLASGAARSFLLTAIPNVGAEADSMTLTLRYDCENSDAAPVISGLNTVQLSFGEASQPDMIAIAITPEQNGILTLNGINRPGAFAVATANVGSAGTLSVRPRAVGLISANLTLTICETDAATGQCLDPRTGQVERPFTPNETASFAIFASASADIAFNPAGHRVFLDVVDSEGVSRGSTSVAVRTAAN